MVNTVHKSKDAPVEAKSHKRGVRGPGRTTREDWLHTAMDTLVSEGVEQVKVITLASKLNCARSSFYWYFKNRVDLLEALLDLWAETNTKAVIKAANKPAETITQALAYFFAEWISGESFDDPLDFAVRDWGRRSGTVRRALDISESARIEAIAAMFSRFGYSDSEAETRARIVYFTQIGYATLDQREDWTARAARSRDYLFCMTGVEPSPEDVAYLRSASLKTERARLD